MKIKEYKLTLTYEEVLCINRILYSSIEDYCDGAWIVPLNEDPQEYIDKIDTKEKAVELYNTYIKEQVELLLSFRILKQYSFVEPIDYIEKIIIERKPLIINLKKNDGVERVEEITEQCLNKEKLQ